MISFFEVFFVNLMILFQKGKKFHHPGQVIHCLMRTAMERKLQEKSCEDELRQGPL